MPNSELINLNVLSTGGALEIILLTLYNNRQADDMIERTSVNITLHDVDPTALRQLIEYTYSGEITITEDNVQVYWSFGKLI